MIFNILPLLAAKRLLDRAEPVPRPTEYGLTHPITMWFFGVLTAIAVAVFVVTLYILYQGFKKD